MDWLYLILLYGIFTSPIRRYPDVMVHRLLQHYLGRLAESPKDRESYEEKMARPFLDRKGLAANAEREILLNICRLNLWRSPGRVCRCNFLKSLRMGYVYWKSIENKMWRNDKVRELKMILYLWWKGIRKLLGKNQEILFQLYSKIYMFGWWGLCSDG